MDQGFDVQGRHEKTDGSTKQSTNGMSKDGTKDGMKKNGDMQKGTSD
jgi:hypothetical protein